MRIKRFAKEIWEWVESLGPYGLIEVSLVGASGGACALYFGVYVLVWVVVILMACIAVGYLYLRSRSRSGRADSETGFGE